MVPQTGVGTGIGTSGGRRLGLARNHRERLVSLDGPARERVADLQDQVVVSGLHLIQGEADHA